MVDLVLEGAGEQAVGFHGDGLAFEVGVGDLDLLGAADIAQQAGEAQAAFFGDGFVAAQLKLRIGEDDGHVLRHIHFLAIDLHEADAVRIVRDVDDGQLHIHGHLRGGQADAVGGAHRFQHVGGQGADFGCDGGHRAAFGAEDRFWVADDFSDHMPPSYHRLFPGSSSGVVLSLPSCGPLPSLAATYDRHRCAIVHQDQTVPHDDS